MSDDVARHLRSIDRTLRAACVLACLVLTLWVLRDIVLLVFASILIACILRLAGNFVHARTKLNIGWSLCLVLLAGLLAFGALVWWRGAEIAEEAVHVAEQLNSHSRRFWEELGQGGWGAVVANQIRSIAESVTHRLNGSIPGIASSVLGFAGSSLVVVATAVFLAASPSLYINGTLALFPPRWKARGLSAMEEIGVTLQHWFLGQLLDMLLVSILTGIGLICLGVPFALTLALIAGLLNFIPYFGALAGSLPAILVAFSRSPMLALWVALLFLGVQMVEGNILTPMIQRRAVALPPALTILSQTIFGALFGLLGVALATPLVATLLVATRLLYVEGVLKKQR